MSQDCPHDYTNPIRKGRADYRCRVCGADITTEVVMIAEADNLAETLKQADEAGINGG